jgi:hypothetical protein
MELLKLSFPSVRDIEVAKLLKALDIEVLLSYSEEGVLEDNKVIVICDISNPGDIPKSLRLEKLREKVYIKIKM